MHHIRSVNEVICHGIPDQRVLVEGDIVNIGMCAPLAITVIELHAYLSSQMSRYTLRVRAYPNPI
jgi:methionine aminopeptidase